jgi:hypothetical protein
MRESSTGLYGMRYSSEYGKGMIFVHLSACAANQSPSGHGVIQTIDVMIATPKFYFCKPKRSTQYKET